MKNIKIVVAYDGTRYFGWQKTKTGRSIEEELERALTQILQEEVSLQAASRTDRGVHAEGQVVNFQTHKSDLDLNLLRKGLNGILLKDIAVKTVEVEESSFHPTLDAKGKEYHYSICNTPVQLPFFRATSWHVKPELSLDLMKKAAESLIGSHDFSAFCNERSLWTRSGVCQLSEIAFIPQEHGRLKISLTGDHFLYKMVRNLVGTLVYVGVGKLTWQEISEILAKRERTSAGMTAPAHGLSLHKVFY
ncbi:MAG: tRNA pseudouridine(38-40) synthase TruA [Chlamydiales bacterium]|nr:tRNA pseudouridine(38-40) synthase TruA [Chlamydiales bacterium]